MLQSVPVQELKLHSLPEALIIFININYPQIPAYVVYCVTVAVGAFNHYLLPHIRKEMPWLCCSQPIVRAREWDVFEVTGMYVHIGSCIHSSFVVERILKELWYGRAALRNSD